MRPQGSPAELEQRRLRAIELLQRDLPVHVVAGRLGVAVMAERVVGLREDAGRVVVLLDGGEQRRCDRLFVPTEVHPSNRLAEELGCATNEDGFIEVDELGRTSVPRVYAAGDASSPVHQVLVAAGSGARAALAANHDALDAFELA